MLVKKMLNIYRWILMVVGLFSPSVHCQVFKFIQPAPVARLVLLSDNTKQFSSTSLNNQTWPYSKPLTPVVFWHGMGDTAKGSITIDRLALEKKFPGIQVYSVQIGKTMVEDELAGYFYNVNQQVQQACESILSNEQIKNAKSFNAIGFSQGAQFLRALAQRCPLKENGIKLKNLISLGGQHQGVFGLPNCNSPTFCEYIRYLLTRGAYEKDIQDHLVQAQYWHDPIHEEEYREKNIFLADINNENGVNQTYKNNLLQLDNLVLVKFEQDEMVVPRESSHFEFYVSGQTKDIQPLESSPIWMEDRLGLRQAAAENRLKLISIPGHHLQYHMSWFLREIGEKYLNN